MHLDSNWTVQLAATYCDAVGSDFDPTCEGTDGNGDPVPHPRNLIHIAPPDSCTVTPLPASCSATSAIRPDEIGGLVNGQTYTVNRVDATHITLQAGGVDQALDPTHRGGDHFGEQQLFAAGLAVQTSSDAQQLYLQLTGSLGNSKLFSPDGTSLRTASPPPGDGLTSSSARGGGGGGISVREPSARTTISPTAVASFAGVAVVGGDVTISSQVGTNGTASTSNGSGGFVSVANVNSQLNGTNTTSAYVGVDPNPLTGDSATVQVDGAGTSITAGGNVRVLATTLLQTNVSANSDSGGFVGTGTASARTGLTDRTAVAVGANARVLGSTVALLGQTSSSGVVRPRITTGGLFGSATANADYTLDSLVLALLDGDASTNGAITGVYGIDVRAFSHDNSYQRNPDATCYCIGPSNDNRGGTVSVRDLVSAHPGMTLYAGPRLPGTPLQTVPGKDFLVLYVQSEQQNNTTGGPHSVTWFSDVVANAGASPSLHVGSDGRVVSAVNIRVNGVTNPAAGDPLSAHPYIEVEDLKNNGSADIWMTSGGGAINGGGCFGGANDDACKLGTAAGTHYWGTFTFDMSWASVTILNESARRLVIDDIDPISRTAVPTVTLFTAPQLATVLTFALRYGVGATLITIRNSHVSGPDLLLNGTIENPVGETRVTNDFGPVTASSQRGGVSTFDGTHSSMLRSNIVKLLAGTGLGTAAQYLVVDLIAFKGHAVVLTATAGGSAYLDLLSHLRDSSVPDPAGTPGAAYTFAVGPIVAGDSVFARLRNSVYETGTGTTGHVQVTATGPSPTGTFVNFYWPDIPFNRGDTEGAFAANPHAINSTYSFSLLDAGAAVGTGSITVDAANPSDVVDTHRINIIALSEIRDTGNITMHTSGSIVDTEKTADLRVNVIKSFDDDVTLTGPANIVDAPDGSGIPPFPGSDGPDVIGVNINLVAGTAGPGSIGAANNYLEVDVAYSRFGLLNAKARGKVFIHETTGPTPFAPLAAGGVAALAAPVVALAGPVSNFYVGLVDTCFGDVCEDVTLTTSNGSILDGHNAGLGGTTLNVQGNQINLVARGGGIGYTTTNSGVFVGDLKVNSAAGSSCTASSSYAWYLATPAQRAVLASCPIAATADTVIYVTELSGAADLLIAETADGDIRITTTQTAVEGNDIRVIHDGTMQVAEDQPPVAVPNGLVFAHNGSVTLLAADNVVTDPSAQILATTRDGDIPVVQPNPNLPKTTTGNIDIFADWHPTVVDPNTNDGAVIVLRGEVTPGTDGLTRVFGAQQDDLIVFDRTLLGGQTRAFGSATPPPLRAYSPAADGSDTLVVYLIPTMPVEGTTLTLDGQGGADDYVVWAHGSQAGDVHYVVNLFDSGAPGDGADTAEVYGADSAANGIDPATGLPYATDDLFLLRGTSYVPGESSARPSLYCGSTSDAPCSQHPAYVAVVHPSQPTPPLPALSADDLAALARTNDYAGVTERINYDGALNGRLAVMSRGGNDLFAVDDTAAIATLDAGDGDDTVLVGQVYGTRRDATFSGLDPPDFFSTIATTRGYLSNGASAPLLAQGGAGDDTFVIGGSQATLRLEGGAGDDTFTIAAYALAQTGRGGTESTGPLFAGTVTIDSALSTITRASGSFLADGFAVGQTLTVRGAGAGNDTGANAYVIAAVTATTITLARNLTTVPPLATSGTFDVSLASGPLARADLEVVYDPILEVSVVARTDGGSFVDDGFEIGQVVVLRDAGANDNSAGVPYVVVDVSDDLLVLDAQLTDGVFVDATVAGSLPRPALTATGGARYPMNGPMSVDGGAGDNVLDITATELGDHLVLGESTVDGAGLGITHRSMGLVAVDALQGNDTVDVLATAPGVITLVVGGLGSDVINVAGDVVGDVLSRDPTGTPTTVNYLLTSADVDYATVVGPGVAAAVARATQGGVVVVDSGGDSHVRGLPNGTPIGTVDSVGVRLAAAPTSDVWVTVSAAASPLVQRPDSGPSADSVYVCTTSAVVCATAAGYFHTVYVDGVPTLVPNREAVLLFTSANWGTTQAVWFAAVNGTLAVPAFVTSISQSVISEDSRFMGMVVRNVAVAEQDALTPDLVVEQVGVGGGTDASTVVIEGTDVTRQTDDVRVSLSHAPVGTVTVSVRPSDSRVVLTSADSRFALGPVLGGVQTYLLTFAAGDWDIPVLLTVAATDDYVRQDRSITVLDLTVDDSVPGNDPAFDAVSRSLDVVVYDDDTAGLVATPSGGSTLVTPSAGGSPISDTVSLRLTKAPTGPVSVSFVTDGQVTPSVAVVVFDETNWWIPVVVSLSGTALVPPAGAGDLFLSPKRPHLLSAVRGDTLLEGGTLDNLHPADEPPPVPVLAPGEHDQARPGVPTQPSEARQVDVLGLFDDGSRADRSGVLTGAALLGMSDGLILFGEGGGDAASRC